MNAVSTLSTAQEILTAAFRRSFNRPLPLHDGSKEEGRIAFIDLSSLPPEAPLPPVGRRQKLLAFGLPAFPRPALLASLGLTADATLAPLDGRDTCAACTPDDHHTESAAHLVYAAHPLMESLTSDARHRPFTRFDFTDEWNNLGFGRIRSDGSIWAVRGGIRADGAMELSAIRLNEALEKATPAGSYLTLFDTPWASILWCARPVGPVDSVEWSVIERFVSDWRANELPCLPCLRQTPQGCNAIVTMRLDCDEDISSARDVFEWYMGEGLPFSLAVKTSLPMTPKHLSLLRDVLASGGTLLSHSHAHAYRWGANVEEVRQDIQASRAWFRDNFPEAPSDLAVSPFHSNPPYAMRTLENEGVTGVVSGIIHNDPEYLLGRAGVPPLSGGSLISISQQSMLHGDCYRQQGESVDVHVRAFDMQHAACGIFGYLDHPFSERYQYGWENKAQRLEAHRQLIATLRAQPNVLFWSQRQCFNFVRALAKINLSLTPEETVRAEGVEKNLPFSPVCRYRGEEIALE